LGDLGTLDELDELKENNKDADHVKDAENADA
jgi:hypothetical protein